MTPIKARMTAGTLARLAKDDTMDQIDKMATSLFITSHQADAIGAILDGYATESQLAEFLNAVTDVHHEVPRRTMDEVLDDLGDVPPSHYDEV